MFEDMLAKSTPNLYDRLMRWFLANRSSLRGRKMTEAQIRRVWAEVGGEELASESVIAEMAAKLAAPSDPFADDTRAKALVKKTLRSYTVEVTGVLKASRGQLSDLIRRVADQPYSVDQIASEVQRIAGNARGQAISVGNTILAQAQRQIVVESARTAQSEDEIVYVYQGPEDGLTRGFCAELLGLALTERQISRLNNGQGLDVMTSGGGWNCRHSWSPMPSSAVRIGGYRFADDTDISRANAAAGS
jgi:hypothetical protein